MQCLGPGEAKLPELQLPLFPSERPGVFTSLPSPSLGHHPESTPPSPGWQSQCPALLACWAQLAWKYGPSARQYLLPPHVPSSGHDSLPPSAPRLSATTPGRPQPQPGHRGTKRKPLESRLLCLPLPASVQKPGPAFPFRPRNKVPPLEPCCLLLAAGGGEFVPLGHSCHSVRQCRVQGYLEQDWGPSYKGKCPSQKNSALLGILP